MTTATAEEIELLRSVERLLADPRLSEADRAALLRDAAPLLDEPEKPTFLEYAQSFTSWKFHRWQVEILIPLIQRLSTERGLRILFHAPPQYGKPCYDGSMVLLKDGRRIRLDEVQVGDVVITHKGRGRKVTAVHVQGELECVKITGNSGRFTIAALDHPFLTPRGWVNAGDLTAGQSLGTVPEPECGGGSGRSDDEFELLGYFVGDGCCVNSGSSINANVTSNDPIQAARFMEVGARLGFGCRSFKKDGTTALTYCFNGGIRNWLREVGMAGKGSYFKTVPDWVYLGTNGQVAKFLGAYFSCDGSVASKGLDRNGEMRPDGTVEFYSVSGELLQGVQHLLTRVGVQSRLTVKNGRYKNERHKSWRLTFSSNDYVSQFAEKVPVYGVKGEKLRGLGTHRRTFQARYLPDQIVNVERVGLMPCRCLTVEEDHTFTVDDFIVHNSHLLSVRGPAWLMGMRPDIKIGLACYNIKKSSDFAKETRDILLDPKHLEWFPDPDGHIPKGAPESGFSTNARKAKRDAQPSLNAMGLQSGFVGLGIGPGDLLIIDDPYSDPKQAQSETENGNVINFWKRAARPRVNEHANVIVMFHRYVDMDLCGVLLEEGGWEYIRLPAMADDNEDGADPTRQHCYEDIREPDGRLSPLNSMSWLNAQKAADPFVFLGQFQGTPRVAGGNLFKDEWFRNYTVTASGDAFLVNGEVILRERCWFFQTVDLAASEKTTADYTVIATWAVTPARQLLLIHVERVRVEGPKVKQVIHAQYRRFRPAFIAIERNGLGMPIVQDLIAGDREHDPLPIRGIWAHRDKLAYATGAAARYQAGQIFHPA